MGLPVLMWIAGAVVGLAFPELLTFGTVNSLSEGYVGFARLIVILGAAPSNRKRSALYSQGAYNMNNKVEQLINNIEHVIIGKRPVIEKVVCAMLAGGHVLIDDVPGAGKSLLAETLA